MKMHGLYAALGCALALAAAPVSAGEDEAAIGKPVGEPKAEKKLEQLVLSGKIEKQKWSRTYKKTGEKRTYDRFVLVDAKGVSVSLPKTATKKAGIDLRTFVGKTVRVIGFGTVTMRKVKGEEKRTVRLKKIAAVEELHPPTDKG